MNLTDEQRAALLAAGLTESAIENLSQFSEEDFALAYAGITGQAVDSESVDLPEAAESEDESDVQVSDSSEVEPEATTADASDDAPALSLFDRARAQLKSRQSLLSEIHEAQARIESLESENEQLAADLEQACNEAAEGREIAQRLAEAEAREKTVSETAAAIAASSHVSAEDLPEASEEPPASIADLREELAKCEDPKEKGKLVRQIQALKKLESAAALN